MASKSSNALIRESKNIWLIYPYGGIPGEGLRPDRPEMIAKALVDAGHKVTWWVSGFDHRNKRHRVKDPTQKLINKLFTINLVPTIAYTKNISIRRILSEFIYSLNLIRWSKGSLQPDLIIMSEPSLFYGNSAVKVIQRSKALLILDVLDLWPEMFTIILPKILKKYDRLIFYFLYKIRKKNFLIADGFLSCSKTYNDLSIKLAPNLNSNRFKKVYFGVYLEEFRNAMRAFTSIPEITQRKEQNEIWIIFSSTLGENYDVRTILKAAIELNTKDIKYRLYIAGAGPLEDLIKSELEKPSLENVYFLGNPSANVLAKIYEKCDVGISAYISGSRVAMPIKAFHYSAAGLAIINSLEGEYQDLLASTGAGIQYESGSHHSLCKAILFYAENPKELIYSKAASNELGNCFDADIQYREIIHLIDCIFKKNSTDKFKII